MHKLHFCDQKADFLTIFWNRGVDRISINWCLTPTLGPESELKRIFSSRMRSSRSPFFPVTFSPFTATIPYLMFPSQLPMKFSWFSLSLLILPATIPYLVFPSQLSMKFLFFSPLAFSNFFLSTFIKFPLLFLQLDISQQGQCRIFTN